MSQLSSVQRIQAIVAIVLGVLGLPQAAWIAYDLYAADLFSAAWELLNLHGGLEDPYTTLALVRVVYGIAFETTLIVMGLVTSAAALVGGGVALTGRLQPLRWASLLILLHIVVLELIGRGLGLTLALVADVVLPMFEPVAFAGGGPSFVLYLRWYCNPLVFALVRAVFWLWTFLKARAVPVTAADVRPA